ncbi:MAG: hypothetical protein WD048_00030 [Chitinophagales bacterium]
MTITNNQKDYSRSVNIIRDKDKNLNYIPTPNAKVVFNQLAKDYHLGVRSFNIVGAYGTGKSAFVWALKKNLNKEHNYFSDLEKSQFKNIKGFEFFQVIGEFDSLMDAFANAFGFKAKDDVKAQDIIHEIDNFYEKLKIEKKGLVIVVDEFGKFLEFAAKNKPDIELYFIQQLAEYVNNTERDILLLTTLHQDFNAYALELTKAQRHEWDKVKGRLKELTFNEPVEQLLYLAAEQLSNKELTQKSSTHFPELFKAIKEAKVFPLRDYFNEDFAQKLLPFDILSASVLTLALQRYGQNERSLFSFIESNDHLGIQDFDGKETYYNISNVYDYLLHNYHSLLSTKFNPHYTQWAAIRASIERSESLMESDFNEAAKLLKTIGLLNIFGSEAAVIDKDFLSKYARFSLGIKSAEKLIDQLEKLKLIRFTKHLRKYNIFEGTDLDIDLAIDAAGNLVEQISDVVYHLKEHFEFPYIPAKAVYYQKGTPRFFEFVLSEAPINEVPEGEIDGFINLIFSENLSSDELKKHAQESNEAILFGWYKNTSEIRNLIYEIEKIKKVREQNLDDKIAKRELDSIIQHQARLLNHYVMGSLHNASAPVDWYFQGKKIKLKDKKSFNRQLSEICDKVYSHTPVFKNELLNKTNVSGAISTARKSLIENLINNWQEIDLSFPSDKFPPEKTIYLSLLKATEIHKKTKEGFVLQKPSEESFKALWAASIEFLDSAKSNKRNLKDLSDVLSKRPFKLKKGFIDFWLPIFLFIKRDDYALFGESGYIPELSADSLNLIVRKPKDYTIKSFDVDGPKLNLFNKYRTLLEQNTKQKVSNKSFIETIRPFFIFYKDLPDYAKNTMRLSKETIALRSAIVQSKEPEKTFFEDFPSALGYSMVQLQKNEKQLEVYVKELQNHIRELRSCYDELINRFEAFIQENILSENLAFPGYKERLQNRFKQIKPHLLLPQQKVFYQRLNSALDDRKLWLSSMGQAIVGKSLDHISDDDEQKLYEGFNDIVIALDNLSEISSADIDAEKEDVFKIEITDFVKGLRKNLVRVPKGKTKNTAALENKIKSSLDKDRQVNIHILVKLLKEQLQND